MKLNKKGDAGDWTNFFGFFLILVVIGGTVVGAYFSFFGNNYNVKEQEADVLFGKFEKCFMENNVFEVGFDIEERCALSKEVLEENHLVYAKELNSDTEPFFIGVRDYVTQCDLIDKRGKFAKCRKEIVIKNGREFELFTGSNQEGRRLASA